MSTPFTTSSTILLLQCRYQHRDSLKGGIFFPVKPCRETAPLLCPHGGRRDRGKRSLAGLHGVMSFEQQELRFVNCFRRAA